MSGSAYCNIDELKKIFTIIKDKLNDNNLIYIYDSLDELDSIDIKNKLMLMLVSRAVLVSGYIIDDNTNLEKCLMDEKAISEGNCDLSLIYLLFKMRLDILLLVAKKFKNSFNIILDISDKQFNKLNIFNKDMKFNKDKDIIITDVTNKSIINDFNGIDTSKISNIVLSDINELNISEITVNFIKTILKKITGEKIEFEMTEKIHIYTILYFLIKNYYNKNDEIKKLYNFLILEGKIQCAPRSFLKIGLKTIGGYNNKSGDIDYHICKANFKQTFKKVSAKSSREAAKMIAMKVLKDKKKSVKFSLKRMIGKKEKCYDYDVSIDKKGKIIIKNQ